MLYLTCMLVNTYIVYLLFECRSSQILPLWMYCWLERLLHINLYLSVNFLCCNGHWYVIHLAFLTHCSSIHSIHSVNVCIQLPSSVCCFVLYFTLLCFTLLYFGNEYMNFPWQAIFSDLVYVNYFLPAHIFTSNK